MTDTKSQDPMLEWWNARIKASTYHEETITINARELWDAAVQHERERCINMIRDAFAWTGGHGEPSSPNSYDLERIIRGEKR